MKIVRWAAAMGAGVLLFAGSASLAGAEISGTNGCQASATWREAGLTVDAATATGVITIPRSDIVDWQASVTAPPGAYDGSVWIELPPPFGRVEVDSWSGDSQTTANSGSHEYDLPSLVPGGVEIVVAGEHTDANGSCSGSVTVQIDGGPFSSPLTAVSLLGTAVTGAGMAALLRPLFRKVV
jgi:hypothetical protein